MLKPDGRRIRIMLVENHQIVADGLTQLLNDQPDMVVVGTADNVAEASSRAAALLPDVILTDFHLTDGTGAEAASEIQQVSPEAKLIFLSREDGDHARLAAIESGAAGFIHKSRAAEEIVDAIRRVVDGGSLFKPEEVAALVQRGREFQNLRSILTPREIEVLRNMAEGASSREMASRLGISYTTVRTHLRSIDQKLGVHSKVEAINKARELGVIE
jgi:DNA-binding NarL/FixJ family response regulator